MTSIMWMSTVLTLGAVVELDSQNWNEVVISDRPALVMFYAPWCGHCKKLKPDWEVLGEESTDIDVTIGRIDCTSDGGKKLCEEHDVRGYPTLKSLYMFMSDDYTGPRSLSELKKFVSSMKRPCSPLSREKCGDDQL